MKSRYLSQFRRRREGKTNYKKRLNLLLSGKPRVVVHKTNTKLIVQIIESDYGKDKTVVALESTFLVKSGWKHSMNSIPGAYLTGLKLAVDAKSKNIKNAVLDIGLLTPTKGAK
ncbi:MAG: 50S ribosomal protein L18, partial [archaeon]|nr:50S ribosomal protein L18 [archaeon]